MAEDYLVDQNRLLTEHLNVKDKEIETPKIEINRQKTLKRQLEVEPRKFKMNQQAQNVCKKYHEF